MPDGPFLYLPVLGPSNPRDFTGFVTDIGLDPLTYAIGGYWAAFTYTRFAFAAADARAAHLDDIDQIKKAALDPYATFRSLYRQYRASEIEQTRDDNRATVPAWYPRPATPATQ